MYMLFNVTYYLETCNGLPFWVYDSLFINKVEVGALDIIEDQGFY